MRKLLWAAALTAATSGDALALQAAAPDGSSSTRSLTVFPSGGALVREVRSLALAGGRNHVQLADLPASLEPQSLVVLTPGVALAGHRGVLLTQRAGGGAQTATLDLELFAEKPVSELRFAYLTGGWSWAASYTVVVSADDRSAHLTGLVTLSNRSGADLAAAEVQLLAGEIYRAGRAAPGFVRLEEARLRAAEALPPSLPAGTVGDYHLYTLPERLTLPSGGDRGVRLVGARDLAAEKRYLFRESVSYFARSGEFERTPVEVAYRIRRAPKDELGEEPLPAGIVRVFRPDDQGRLQLLGEAAVGNMPKREDLWLPVGRAFEVTARRTQTDYQVREVDRARGLARYESAWRIELENRTDRAVTVEVVETVGGDWRVLSATHKYEKTSATALTFHVPVPANGDAALEYRIEVRR